MQKTYLQAAIIVAGGTGTRMGGNLPKQFLLLQDIPILIHTLRCFWRLNAEMKIVVVMHASFLADWEEMKQNYLTEQEQKQVFDCNGGKERVNSVQNGMEKLQTLFSETQNLFVAIHDAVRPFVSKELIDSTFQSAYSQLAAIPCVPVKASLRKVNQQTQHSQPVPRAEYWEVQTPQVLHFETYKQCLENRNTDDFTDDASLFQILTQKEPGIVMGEYTNIKITTPEDMWVGEQILRPQ